MFNKNDITMYKYMREELEGFIKFCEDFFNKEENRLILNFNNDIVQVREVNNFVCLITNGDGLPLGYINLIENKIRIININEFTIDKYNTLLENAYVKASGNLNSKLRSLFISKRKKNEIESLINQVYNSYISLLEINNSYNRISASIQKLINKALSEYNKREIELQSSCMYIRYNDVLNYKKTINMETFNVAEIIFDKLKEEIF